MSDFPIPPIGVWTGALDTVPASRSRELAAELEELGYGALWLPEVAGRDPFVHLALLLSSTTRLIGATGIANIWGRDALAMSGAVRGLTEAFPERVLIGLGVSHQPAVEGLRGHKYEKPLAAMTGYVDRLLAAPYFAAKPETPVRLVLAALGPKMLALAAARTEGAHPYFVPVEHTSVARDALGPDALLCPEQMVVLETDPTAAREIARRHMATYLGLPNYTNNLRRLGWGDDDLGNGGSDRLVDAIVAWGDEAAIQRRVQAHRDAGANHVCVQVLVANPREAPLDGWRRLAPALLA